MHTTNKQANPKLAEHKTMFAYQTIALVAADIEFELVILDRGLVGEHEVEVPAQQYHHHESHRASDHHRHN